MMMDLMEVPSHITAPKGIALKPSEVDPNQMGLYIKPYIPKYLDWYSPYFVLEHTCTMKGLKK